jgi:hypothetical protein
MMLAPAPTAARKPNDKSDEVANTLATLLSLFPQTGSGVTPQLISTPRGNDLLRVISLDKPFSEVKAVFHTCDVRRDLNAVEEGERGDAPLHKAAERGAVDTIKLLLSAGANMKQSNLVGNMAFHVAAFYNRAEAVAEFLKRGMVRSLPLPLPPPFPPQF